jgi:ankyrin repeat protein
MSAGFFEAIRQGNQEEVERRLQLNPSLTQAKENGLSPILLAAYHHRTEIASLLANKTVALTIFEAAAIGKLKNIIRLLAHEPELVNEYAEDGFQALGLASYFGHLEVAEYLVKAGAPINSPSRNDLKAAPIQSAAAAGHVKIVKLLLEHQADPNVREQGDYTPLHTAAQNGDEEMIRVLLFAGADPNVKSADGKFPLDLAKQKGHAKAAAIFSEGITKRFKALRPIKRD